MLEFLSESKSSKRCSTNLHLDVDTPTLVIGLFYTGEGRGQCLVFSVKIEGDMVVHDISNCLLCNRGWF